MGTLKIGSNKGEKPSVNISVAGTIYQFSPEENSTMILQQMKPITETLLDQELYHAVVTATAYFNDTQHHATTDVGIIAGRKVAHMIDDPNVPSIVLRNKHDNCETGVGLTCHPANGDNIFHNAYLLNAHGEDVVTGL